jgi:hypothetical protein
MKNPTKVFLNLNYILCAKFTFQQYLKFDGACDRLGRINHIFWTSLRSRIEPEYRVSRHWPAGRRIFLH